jgi:phospholipid-translocating ATPase
MSLSEATKNENISMFLQVAMKANCVCCCRCAPSQKREITNKLKKLGKRVLGIGDGGNDVGMIQEAHVGIGIEGKEGKQAALASDYSVQEFQDVVKLVLWHGRMIYMTVSKMCSFVMHRGLIIATIQFFFIIMFFFIDIPIFNGFLTFGYSTIFTNLPVIAIIMDEDLDFTTLKRYPILYRELQLGRLLNYKAFFIMLLKAVFQGSSIILLTILLFPTNVTDIVTITFTALIITELLNTVTIVEFRPNFRSRTSHACCSVLSACPWVFTI